MRELEEYKENVYGIDVSELRLVVIKDMISLVCMSHSLIN
jgi:hypothetical protein